MKRNAALLSLGALAVAVTPAFAQQTAERPALGVSVGAYFPTNSTIRDAFGGTLFSVGVSPVGFTRPSSGKITPSFNLITGSKNGNKFLLIPVTLGYEYHFGVDEGSNGYRRPPSTVPYARIAAGVSYYDFSVDVSDSDHRSAKAFGATGSAEVGVVFNKQLRLSASYNVFQSRSDLDFSGFQVNLTYGLFRF